MITPDTRVWLCSNVPMCSDYSHHRLFDDENARLAYFTAKAFYKGTAYSYQRNEGEALLEIPKEQAAIANYFVYANGQNVYYNFVKKVEYENETTSKIVFEEDVLNTWWKKLITRKSFVEREHVNNDNIGANLVEEDVDTGEFINYNSDDVTHLVSTCIVLGFSWTSEASNSTVTGTVGSDSVSLDVSAWTKKFAGGGLQCNVYSGVKYVAYTDPEEVNRNLSTLVNEGLGEAITCIFMMPVSFLPDSYDWGTPITNIAGKKRDILIRRWPTLDGYAPKNNKLFDSQFSFVQIYDNNGGIANFFHEFFDNKNEFSFEVASDFGANASAKLTPKNYKGIPFNYSESMTISHWPLCSYSYSAYEQYLGANKSAIGAKLATSVMTSATNIIGSAVAGNFTGALGGLATSAISAANSIAAHKDRMREPNQVAGNANGGNINAAIDKNTFTIYNRGITEEFARKIDDYFSVYGYKVNSVKVPNFKGRRSWNYVKCNGFNCFGEIPADALEKIKNIMNNGCTFWHTDDVLNYSLDNSII